ncbi:hypothetical protein [Leuconostoc citreum]|uniref:hypothetical protein n=1 Tax=Leuconostoc citreum TaxID=33964 RepID=UPI00200A8DDD|nr:hypothetical protein [Leuconostoc citreum]MCK8605894.1 hypothetical protein [Leuconostoc citreum]
MNKILRNTIVSGAVAILGVSTVGTTVVNATTISDGTNNADVTVNGTLGADNTDPVAPIPEGSDKWINVTLDTATIFYNTQTDKNIVSPTYNITNNSGRPVSFKVNSFKQNDSVPLSSISSLNANFTRKVTATDTSGSNVSTNLITGGSINSDFSSATSTQLANKNGMLSAKDTSGAYSNSATFNYNGTVTDKLTATINPKFTMNLLFTPSDWTK